MAPKQTSLASYPQRANAGLYTLSQKTKFMTRPLPFRRLIKQMRADTEYFGPLGPKVDFFTQKWLKMLDDERYIDYDDESEEIHIRDSAKVKFRDVREEIRTAGLSSKKEKRLRVAKRLNMGYRLSELTKAELLGDNAHLRSEIKRLEAQNEELEAKIASSATQIAPQLSFIGTEFQQEAGMETGPEPPDDMEGIEETSNVVLCDIYIHAHRSLSARASPVPIKRLPSPSSITHPVLPESDPFAPHEPQTERELSVHAAYPTPVSAPRFGGAQREPPVSPTPSGGSFVQRGEESLSGLQGKAGVRRECSQRLHEIRATQRQCGAFGLHSSQLPFAGTEEKWTPGLEHLGGLEAGVDAGIAEVRAREEEHHREVLRLIEDSRSENKKLHQQTQAESIGQWEQIKKWGKDVLALMNACFKQGQANHAANQTQFQAVLEAGEKRGLQVAELGAAHQQHFQTIQVDGIAIRQYLQDLDLAHQRTYDLVQALEERLKASGEQISAQTARIDALEANCRLCEELHASKLELEGVERELEEARQQRGAMAQERDSLADKLGVCTGHLTVLHGRFRKMQGLMDPIPGLDEGEQGVAV